MGVVRVLTSICRGDGSLVTRTSVVSEETSGRYGLRTEPYPEW